MTGRRRAGAPKSAAPDFTPRISVPLYATAVAFNADGSRLYAVAEGAVFGFPRGSKERITFDATDDRPGALAVGATGAVVCTTDTAILLYDPDGKLQRSTPLTEGVDVAESVAFSPDGALFAVGTGHLNSERTTIEIFSAAGERLRLIEPEQGFGIPNVCFTSDGRYVITVRSGSFERWPIDDAPPERTYVSELQFDKALGAARGLIVVGQRGFTAVDEHGRLLWQQRDDIQRVAVSPDAAWVVTGKGRTLTVYTAKGEVAKTITRKSTKEVRALAISADGWLAVGTDGGVEMLRLTDAAPAARPAPRSAAADAPVAESWRRIDAWLSTAGHEPANRGASEAAISDLARQLAVPLPAELAQGLAIHDGADGLIGGWTLLGTEAIASEAKLMKQLADSGTFAGAEADAHPRIKSVWWNVHWIPVVSSGSGHLFCVDLDPAPAGKPGQVILFFHDDGKRLCVADSFAAWLAAIAVDLESGTYEYDADSQSWSDEAFLQSSLEGKETYG